ncbi:unnamed protein product [Gongylonema pulchrum]|uniref:Uncharacterized protein n=1 Tax=Gongylonema pulchrum TaxID=637853 RepID=A0A3P6R794_9BILA|nr:unnamed protein product [Gongylonema pulchrum]
MAHTILDEFFYPELERLADPSSLEKARMLKSLEIVSSCLAGVSAALPALSGKLIPLTDSPAKVYPFHFVAAPARVKAITHKGKNLRDFVLERLKSVAEFLLQHRENDTKSLCAVCKILHILLFQRGIDRVRFRSCHYYY